MSVQNASRDESRGLSACARGQKWLAAYVLPEAYAAFSAVAAERDISRSALIGELVAAALRERGYLGEVNPTRRKLYRGRTGRRPATT